MKISKENIILNCDVYTKEELLTIVSLRAFEIGAVNNSDRVLHDFLKREEEGPTGLQDNFAIPHAKSESVLESTIIYIRNKNIINEWESFDEKGICHAFALLVKKEQEGNEHLTLLSNLAVALMEDEFKNNIKKSNDEEGIAKIITNAIEK